MTSNTARVAYSLAVLTFATPAPAAEAKPVDPPHLTQQDLNDIATALSIVGSHCNADQPQACQAGADSKAVFAKLAAIFQAQQEKDTPKK